MIYKSSWSNRFEVKPDRWVYNPTPESRKEGQLILKLLNKCWIKPSYYYHLRSGGHVEALSIHLENKYFATVDIVDFFGHISRTRITRALKRFLKYDDARKIAKISTIKAMKNYPHSHHLPYGFVQSPLLSSICLFDSSLGQFIEALIKKNKATVSVYMDDIVISSNDKTSLEILFNKLHVVAEKSSFSLNSKSSDFISNKCKVFNIIVSHRHMEIECNRFIQFQNAYSLSRSQYQKDGIKSYVHSINQLQASLLL